MNARRPDGKHARRIARKIIAPTLPSWESAQRTRVFYAQGDRPVDDMADADRALITRGGEVVAVIPRAALYALEPEWRRLIVTLVQLLQEQAMIAEWTHPFAAFDVDANEKRLDGSSKGARIATKRGRATVEQLMRACAEKREDASEHFKSWATIYGYSTRQLQRIWNEVQGQT